ncbi:hypothetical protein [Rhodanobacter thiooxydans]|uniref:hypothetical protein n=1 Tax=Rhodanobacter thiooxydans TaxID=416169 RepID=UPI000586E6CB|nr:hypothetical protein [Rhodanobacter thiooxydans]
MQDLRAGIAGAGVVSPHAFIRGLDAGYDREVMLDQWLRPLNEADDLRFRFQHGDSGEHWVLMESLPWDSEFFGRGMARLNAVIQPGIPVPLRTDTSHAAEAVRATLELAKARGIDYVFAPVSPNDLPTIRVLSTCGFDLIETRCHYHRPLNAPPTQRHSTRLATTADIPSLAHAARVMVNPFDRFHADPAVSEKDADRLMERWVEASIAGGFADATIVPDVDAPEAFCTAKYHREHWAGWGCKLSQPVLSAVAPKHKGWYVKIISELDEHLRSIGAEHSFLITQITNNAVIRSWEKLGYGFGKGEHIFRKLL